MRGHGHVAAGTERDPWQHHKTQNLLHVAEAPTCRDALGSQTRSQHTGADDAGGFGAPKPITWPHCARSRPGCKRLYARRLNPNPHLRWATDGSEANHARSATQILSLSAQHGCLHAGGAPQTPLGEPAGTTPAPRRCQEQREAGGELTGLRRCGQREGRENRHLVRHRVREGRPGPHRAPRGPEHPWVAAEGGDAFRFPLGFQAAPRHGTGISLCLQEPRCPRRQS